jgi:hypothetical protein
MNKLNLKRVDGLIFIHTYLHLLSWKRNSNTYNEKSTKMCYIERDKWDIFYVAAIFEVASISHEEHELNAAHFNDDEVGNNLTPFS